MSTHNIGFTEEISKKQNDLLIIIKYHQIRILSVLLNCTNMTTTNPPVRTFLASVETL